MLLFLLDIVDDTEKALQYTTDAEQPFVKGVQIIYLKSAQTAPECSHTEEN
jgi:molecular chaperone GrpE (heat shock protein)